jgi:hypothetical protein
MAAYQGWAECGILPLVARSASYWYRMRYYLHRAPAKNSESYEQNGDSIA